jgi:hypothetical protein
MSPRGLTKGVESNCFQPLFAGKMQRFTSRKFAKIQTSRPSSTLDRADRIRGNRYQGTWGYS